MTSIQTMYHYVSVVDVNYEEWNTGIKFLKRDNDFNTNYVSLCISGWCKLWGMEYRDQVPVKKKWPEISKNVYLVERSEL